MLIFSSFLRAAASLFLTLAVLLIGLPMASAQQSIKIGIIGPFSGPFAYGGDEFKHGISVFLKERGDTVGNRKVEIIYRDSGANPATTKQLAEELIVKDRVSILGGFFLSPEAIAVAPIVNEAKIPTLLFTPAAPGLLSMSPYFVRMAQNIRTPGQIAADWAREAGKTRAYTAVADYDPGHDVEGAFTAEFSARGGTIVGGDRIPLNTVDFAPFAERVANANPDFLEIFIPPGAPALGYLKALAARNLLQKVTVFGQAEADDNELHLFDASVVGFYSVQYIASAAPYAENEQFKKALRDQFGPTAEPTVMSVGAHDSMLVAYKMIDAMGNGPFNGDAAIKSLLGFHYSSPRGPVTIDATTRENIQNYYVRRVALQDGKLSNVIVKTFENVKAPDSKN